MAVSERAKTPQWDSIPEENCILDKDTLSWATADDDTENSPDIPGSAKRLRLEDQAKSSPCTCSDQQLKTFSEGFVLDNIKANTDWSVCVFNELVGSLETYCSCMQMMLFPDIFCSNCTVNVNINCCK